MSIVKNQHYVPKVYLRKFADTNEQLYVFDKSEGRHYRSNIKNVACEKYFYDIPAHLLNDNADIQIVEKQLNKLEGRFKDCRDAILERIDSRDRIEASLKDEFAEYVVLQFLRTKTHRQIMVSMSDFLSVQASRITSLTNLDILPDDQVAFTHANMMFSPAVVVEMKQVLINHIWTVGVNRTALNLYTSDSPITRFPHVKNPLMGTNGMACEGIEINYPLSPNHVLIMAERSFHGHMTRWENSAFPITNEECILFMNQMQVAESYRQVYSSVPDFSHAVELVKRNPDVAVLERPRIQLGNSKI